MIGVEIKIIYHWYSAGETEAGRPGFIFAAVWGCVRLDFQMMFVGGRNRHKHKKKNRFTGG